MANQNMSVHDALIRPLELERDSGQAHLAIYRFGDHLLHRIGLIELRQIQEDAPYLLRVRSEADELWALVEGDCTFAWVDERDDSPTHGNTQFHTAESPTIVLAPFGVAFGVRTESTAKLIRLATHDELEDASGVTRPWPER
ncbi:MAG: hypothetical protein WBR18_00685 [Anaerolineales bacterium]